MEVVTFSIYIYYVRMYSTYVTTTHKPFEPHTDKHSAAARACVFLSFFSLFLSSSLSFRGPSRRIREKTVGGYITLLTTRPVHLKYTTSQSVNSESDLSLRGPESTPWRARWFPQVEALAGRVWCYSLFLVSTVGRDGQQDSRREQRVGRGLLVSGRSLSFLRGPLGPRTSHSLLLFDPINYYLLARFLSILNLFMYSIFYIHVFHILLLSYEIVIFCI